MSLTDPRSEPSPRALGTLWRVPAGNRIRATPRLGEPTVVFDLDRLLALTIDAELWHPDKRDLLLAGVPENLRVDLPVYRVPRDQIHSDIIRLMLVELGGGAPGLSCWLHNLEVQLSSSRRDLPEARTQIAKARDALAKRRADGTVEVEVVHSGLCESWHFSLAFDQPLRLLVRAVKRELEELRHKGWPEPGLPFPGVNWTFLLFATEHDPQPLDKDLRLVEALDNVHRRGGHIDPPKLYVGWCSPVFKGIDWASERLYR